jgi:hypothetical protein
MTLWYHWEGTQTTRFLLWNFLETLVVTNKPVGYRSRLADPPEAPYHILG